MTDKELRKFKLVDKEGYFSNHIINQDLFIEYSKDGIFHGYMFYNELYSKPDKSSVVLIGHREFKYFEEVVEDAIEEESFNTKDDMSSEWGAYPPVGTECSLWTPRSGKNKDFDCKVLGYHKDSCGDSVVWVEKLNCTPHEEPFRTYLLDRVAFSKIEPRSWQEVLCEEFDIVYSAHDDTFNFERKYSSNEIIKLAKRIIELSDPKED